MKQFIKTILQTTFFQSNLFIYCKKIIHIIFKNNTVKENQIDYSKINLEYLSDEKQSEWEKRIKDVLKSPDNKHIPRAPNAGKIIKKSLIMHNGIKINPLSYCSYPMLKMLIKNKGVHEPQEERVFLEVLKTLPPKSVMLELGSYWAFYSMWFFSTIKKATCYMVEPNKECLHSGIKNFKLNKMNGIFYNAYIGRKFLVNEKGEKTISVDFFVKEKNIDFIHILHADIQGKELEMLYGAKKLITDKKIGYIFISTHSNVLHELCIHFLTDYNFILICSVNLDETYSYDGLIVMRAPYFPGIEPFEISRKPMN